MATRAAARPPGWVQAGAPRRHGPWLGPEGPRGFAPAIGCADAALFALRMVNDATTSTCGPFPLGIAYGDTRDKLISAVHPAWTHRGELEYLDRLLEEKLRIHPGVVEAQGPVQVGTRGSTRAAHFADGITRAEQLPFLDSDLREVAE